MTRLCRVLLSGLFLFALTCPASLQALENNAATVALVMKSLSNPFFIQMEQGAKGYAGENEFPLEVFGIKNPTDVALQISIVENLISRNYGAIVIAPADSEKLIPVCKKAVEKGIVVINIDNPLNRETLKSHGLTIPFVGSDNRTGGHMMGEYVKRRLDSRGKVVIIEGIRGVENAELRKRGFTEAVTEDSHIEIIASESAFWNTEQAFSLTMRLLEKHPRVDAIFCANDKMALGVLQALDLLNRKNIMVAGYDNIESVRHAIRIGKMCATMEQHPELMGEYGVMLAWKKLNGHNIPNTMSTPLDLITREHFNKKIGFSVSDLENPFFASMIKGAKKEAALYGMTLSISDAGNNDSQQLMDIVNFQNQQIDAIIVNPTNAETIIPGIDMARVKNIPVITVDRKISGGKILSHVASDNIQGGRMAAGIIAAHLNNRGRVVEMEGIPGTSAAHDRGLGFNDELKTYPDITIVAREAANFDRTQAGQLMERLHNKGIEFDAVFAHNDAMILGAMDVLTRKNALDSKVMVGFDAIKEAVKAVKDKKITATIAQQPQKMGQLSIRTMALFFRGDKIEPVIPVSLSPVSLSKYPRQEGPIAPDHQQ